MVTLPVSGSTSTSQNWVEKPGAMPPALTEAAAVIGPPVRDRLAASSLKGNGGKSPTLLLAGLAWPSSHTTPSTSTSQISAARARNSSTTFLLASMTAMPVAKVTREPPVTPANRGGVGDDRADLIVVDPESLGRHQRHRGARAADLDRPSL